MAVQQELLEAEPVEVLSAQTEIMRSEINSNAMHLMMTAEEMAVRAVAVVEQAAVMQEVAEHRVSEEMDQVLTDAAEMLLAQQPEVQALQAEAEAELLAQIMEQRIRIQLKWVRVVEVPEAEEEGQWLPLQEETEETEAHM